MQLNIHAALVLNAMAFALQAQRQARQLVLADQARYDEAWLAMLSRPEEKLALSSLDLQVQQLRDLGKVAVHPLQLNRARFAPKITAATPEWHSGGQLLKLVIPRLKLLGLWRASAVVSQDSSQGRQAWASLLDVGVEGFMDPLLPVDSLDQLYFQAVTLNPILISKVQLWAAASRGYFCSAHSGEEGLGNTDYSTNNKETETQASANTMSTRDSSQSEYRGYVLWENVLEKEHHIGRQVSWAKIKTVKRSIEKSTRSYGKVMNLLLIGVAPAKLAFSHTESEYFRLEIES
jgi:hypothetical protein